MEWPKIKNVIIVILLFVNGFLLLLVGGQLLREQYTQRSALQRAAQILEQNGITISEDALTQIGSSASSPMTVGRDLAAEGDLAALLLGEEAGCTDQSGGLYLYSSPVGTAAFRASGECSVSFTSPQPASGSLPDHAREYLHRLGLDGEVLSADEGESGETVVLLRQLYDDTPLYSCTVAFTYSSLGLTSIQGNLLITSEPPVFSEEATLDATTALIRFLAAVLDTGDLCSSVTSIRPGYLTVSSFGSSTYFRPVWLVSTNVSLYYLDGITGELSRAS